jgi:hypothetical protein
MYKSKTTAMQAKASEHQPSSKDTSCIGALTFGGESQGLQFVVEEVDNSLFHPLAEVTAEQIMVMATSK